MTINIREAEEKDHEAIWTIFSAVVVKGDTYAIAPDIGKEAGLNYWLLKPSKTFVAEIDGEILGTYYIKANQDGPGSHVCNCGYMVAAAARGKGLATAMCRHSLDAAKRLGFRGMQYNIVVSTNAGAVRLWQKLGFEIVGTVPKAFDHPGLGFVDAYVMFQWLGS